MSASARVATATASGQAHASAWPGWDDVIVGAGSAGAILASRLTECQDRRVLLLEAGAGQMDVPRTSELPGWPVLDGCNWDYSAYVGTEAEGRLFPYRMGKVVGGSSAVNGAIALRGLPADFDGWAAAGNPEWAWERVLPYFTRIEADTDFTGPGHGTEGPIPIQRAARSSDPVADAFIHACQNLGLPRLPDLNCGAQTGVGPVPTNTRDGRRMSSAEAYLAPVRPRPNLTVWPGCHVVRVRLAGLRVTGVEVIRDGRRLDVAAGQVTLSAGAVGTPLILYRSGLGPASALAAAGIPTAADLPGVGENLADHPIIAIWSVQRTGGCAGRPSGHSVMARVATAGATPDVNLYLASNMGLPDLPGIGKILGHRICVGLSAMLLAPTSRGRVFLRDAAPDAKPVIVLRLASDPADAECLMRAARLAWCVAHASPLAELLEPPLLWTERLVSDDTLLRAAVRKFVSPMWHPAGTARMGRADDPMAVVDQHCRVYGVDGLRIVDASVMPSLPGATPNLTCIMIAERVAGWMSQPG